MDGIYGWRNGLPAEKCNYSMQRLYITLDDGVKLAADLYQPIDCKALGTLLVRTIYGLSVEASMTVARIFAARGYQVLHNNSRGSFDSEGELDPAVNEPGDGQAVVAWMRKQSWYTGSFATLGGSYLGYTQWALLNDPPHDLKAAIIYTGCNDYYDFIWGAGSGALSSHIIVWADVMRRLRTGRSRLGIMVDVKMRKEYLGDLFNSTPLLEAVDKYFKGQMPAWLRRTLTNSDAASDYWAARRMDSALEKANIPILLNAGWDDVMLDGVMNHYQTLKQRGCDVALTVGPWSHAAAAGADCLDETFEWLETKYTKTREPSRETPVKIYVTGAKEWRNIQEWPPAMSDYEIYLNAGKVLTRSPSYDAGTNSTFTFDPENATPSIGGVALWDDGKLRNADCSPLAKREDVLVFDTQPLESDLEVLGQPTVELQHSADNPNVDLYVFISEVNAAGYSHNISERYMRLQATQEPSMVKLGLGDCAHRFSKGNRIRLHVAGGSHPRYIRNLGSGQDPATGSTLRASTHTVYHDGDLVSKLTLPAPADKV